MYTLANSNVIYRERFGWCGNMHVYSVVYIATKLAWVQ